MCAKLGMHVSISIPDEQVMSFRYESQDFTLKSAKIDHFDLKSTPQTHPGPQIQIWDLLQQVPRSRIRCPDGVLRVSRKPGNPYIDHFLIQRCVLTPPRVGGLNVFSEKAFADFWSLGPIFRTPQKKSGKFREFSGPPEFPIFWVFLSKIVIFGSF